MAVQNLSGTDVILKVDNVAVACAQDISVSIETAMDSVTCRASGGWTEVTAGRHSWTGSLSAVWRIATGTDATSNRTTKDFVALQMARTPIQISFGSGIAGDTIYTGTAYINSTELSGPEEGSATTSISLTGTGPLVPSVNPANPA